MCQQLKRTSDDYPGKTTALEKVAMEKPELFRAIHSKFKTNIAAEKGRVDNSINTDCLLKRDPEFLSKTYQYKLFANMEKIIAQFRREMCAKMKEHIIKKYSAMNIGTYKDYAFDIGTVVYKKEDRNGTMMNGQPAVKVVWGDPSGITNFKQYTYVIPTTLLKKI